MVQWLEGYTEYSPTAIKMCLKEKQADALEGKEQAPKRRDEL